MKIRNEMDLLGLSVKSSFCIRMNPTTYPPSNSAVPNYSRWACTACLLQQQKSTTFLYGHVMSTWMTAINPLWMLPTPVPSPDLMDPG